MDQSRPIWERIRALTAEVELDHTPADLRQGVAELHGVGVPRDIEGRLSAYV